MAISVVAVSNSGNITVKLKNGVSPIDNHPIVFTLFLLAVGYLTFNQKMKLIRTTCSVCLTR